MTPLAPGASAPDATPPATQPASWLATREVGHAWGMVAIKWLSRLCGRRPVHPMLWLIAFYYVCASARVRRVSREYMARAGGRSDFWGVVWHVYRFAQCTLDRLYLLSGELRYFDVERRGSQELESLVAAGRGAILVGAHFGSFEAMRAVASDKGIVINILVHEANAQKIAGFLAQFSSDQQRLRVLSADPGNPGHLLRVRERIEAGEFVAILGDRVGLNERMARVDFLGEAADFPTGPWLIAALLRCPVLFVVGCFEAPNRYFLHCELLCERVELPRGRRNEALADHVRNYARRLERECRRRPDNWFNFYDFWAPTAASSTDHV